jgi:hypothetical protein
VVLTEVWSVVMRPEGLEREAGKSSMMY